MIIYDRGHNTQIKCIMEEFIDRGIHRENRQRADFLMYHLGEYTVRQVMEKVDRFGVDTNHEPLIRLLRWNWDIGGGLLLEISQMMNHVISCLDTEAMGGSAIDRMFTSRLIDSEYEDLQVPTLFQRIRRSDSFYSANLENTFFVEKLFRGMTYGEARRACDEYFNEFGDDYSEDIRIVLMMIRGWNYGGGTSYRFSNDLWEHDDFLSEIDVIRAYADKRSISNILHLNYKGEELEPETPATNEEIYNNTPWGLLTVESDDMSDEEIEAYYEKVDALHADLSSLELESLNADMYKIFLKKKEFFGQEHVVEPEPEAKEILAGIDISNVAVTRDERALFEVAHTDDTNALNVERAYRDNIDSRISDLDYYLKQLPKTVVNSIAEREANIARKKALDKLGTVVEKSFMYAKASFDAELKAMNDDVDGLWKIKKLASGGYVAITRKYVSCYGADMDTSLEDGYAVDKSSKYSYGFLQVTFNRYRIKGIALGGIAIPLREISCSIHPHLEHMNDTTMCMGTMADSIISCFRGKAIEGMKKYNVAMPSSSYSSPSELRRDVISGVLDSKPEITEQLVLDMSHCFKINDITRYLDFIYTLITVVDYESPYIYLSPNKLDSYAASHCVSEYCDDEDEYNDIYPYDAFEEVEDLGNVPYSRVAIELLETEDIEDYLENGEVFRREEDYFNSILEDRKEAEENKEEQDSTDMPF